MKTSRLLSVFVLALSFFCLSSCASDADDYEPFGTLYGLINDEASGEPISGATITLSPGGKTQTSGSDGRYEFPDLDPQQYTVTVQKPGYSTNRKTVNVIVSETTQANVSLRQIQK